MMFGPLWTAGLLKITIQIGEEQFETKIGFSSHLGTNRTNATSRTNGTLDQTVKCIRDRAQSLEQRAESLEQRA